MKKYLGILLFFFIGLFCSAQEQIAVQDSVYLQEALEVLKSYNTNDSLRQALMILQKNIEQDKTQKAVEILKNASSESLAKIGGKRAVDSLLQCLKEDEYFTWFSDLARDSVQFSFFDVQGNETKLWTNTNEVRSQRYWLYKSPTDSLGFWLHSMPEKGVLLIPDFDVYQESQRAEETASLLLPIPVRENPEQYKLMPFRDYPRILQPWEMGIVANVGFSQSYFEHWVKGGENSIAMHSDIRAFLNYKKYKTEWENYLRWKYGLMQSEKADDFVRNEDILEFNSKLGLKASKNWYYSTQLNIKTQIFNGYVYKDDKESKVSDFLSPGYLSLALGMDYKPNKHFSLLLSPITGRLSYMNDIDELDETTYGIEKGKHFWGQLGPYVGVKWNDKLFKSVNIDTSLELFSNYFNKPLNIDMDWSTVIDMRINYFMSTRLSFQLIYDDDVEVPLYEKVNGVKQKVGTGKRLQFNENLSVGLVFML
ncbi:MAG: DUF3078 domain-containing protein [Flavobacteriaceae bacterium]|nr:DUF3078 domain-containing protein [Flavobacteriaceae bacterium]